MKLAKAVEALAYWDQRGLYLYTPCSLGLALSESGRTLRSTIARIGDAGVLGRAAHGLYYYRQSRHIGAETIGAVACLIRRGQFCYEGLESAASRWGIVSQIPVDRLTVVTTGREGTFSTPFGTIEFVHSEAKPAEMIRNTIRLPGHPLRVATREYTVRYLQKCKRSLDLIDWDEVHANG